MKWYEIDINLSLSLLESTYTFIWPYVQGITVEKKDRGFLIKTYLYTSSTEKFIKKLNKFLHIMAKNFKTIKPHVLEYAISENAIKEKTNNDFIIVPTPSIKTPPFGIIIKIQRGMAFGVGGHPCTIYCLQAIKDLFSKNSYKLNINRVLDAGAGTGILSIATAKLGANNIIGVEISMESFYEAKENIRINKFTNEIKMINCSVTEIKDHFDLILANLYGPLLLNITQLLIQRINPEGLLVLGGMCVPFDDAVISKFIQYGMNLNSLYRDEEWSVAILQRN